MSVPNRRTDAPLLDITDLRVTFRTEDGPVTAVDGIAYDVQPGQVVGIVGESGSGKSVGSLAVMRLLGASANVRGSVRFAGRDLLPLPEPQMRRVRGNDIAMIFQEPLTSLNPILTVGDQIIEPLMLHQGLGKAEARNRTIEMLRAVGIPSPERRIDAFPHHLSGGLRQRAMIAMALSCDPKLLIADEPTTALDVSIQAQILELMRDLQRTSGMSMIFITHDLGVVAELAHEVVVMYAGRVVERATTTQLFAAPKHPYAWGLFDCLPRIEDPRGTRLLPIAGQPPNLLHLPGGCPFHPRCPQAMSRCATEKPPLFPISDGHVARCWLYEGSELGIPSDRVEVSTERSPQLRIRLAEVNQQTDSASTSNAALLTVTGLQKYFPITAGLFQRKVADVQAVDGVDFTLGRGETLGLVGESGCGKSTTGRAVLRLIEPTSGHVRFDGLDVTGMRQSDLRSLRRRMQIIFQDPYSSLNPRRTVGGIIAQPLVIHGIAKGKQAQEHVAAILKQVGLNPQHADRYPHEFSGGQRQRIGIARAIAGRPDFIVADEPVSALDVSIQAQIVNLLEDLRADLGLSYLFISHNLSVVRSICDRVAVMYLGQIVELASNADLYENPLHPYTMALLSAVPKPDPTVGYSRIVLPGDVPSPINPPSGCRFHTRCPYAFARCRTEKPPLGNAGGGHLVACHLYPMAAAPAGSETGLAADRRF